MGGGQQENAVEEISRGGARAPSSSRAAGTSARRTACFVNTDTQPLHKSLVSARGPILPAFLFAVTRIATVSFGPKARRD
jgi:hypothetical protein